MDGLLSIVAMTEYDPTIWDNFHVPSPLDADEAKARILLDCGELELLYTKPDLLKYMITNWVTTESHVWQKLADTLNLQYNPIYNLDVTWEETRTPDLTKTRTPNITEASSREDESKKDVYNFGSRTPNITTTETPTDTTTEAVAGFNTSTFENSRQTTRGGTITTSETGSEVNVLDTNTKDVMKGNEQKTTTGTETETETGTDTITTRRYGNQGVTMTQDMIQKEREIAQFNLYGYISKSFKNRFCMLVY